MICKKSTALSKAQVLLCTEINFSFPEFLSPFLCPYFNKMITFM